MTTIAQARRFYAEELRVVTGLHSARLYQAFAQIPREHFLGPPPWEFASGAALLHPDYRSTRSPRDLYHDVVVALDAARMLNTAQPSLMARMIDALDLKPGQHVLHLGCGSGYYAAILASIVGRRGRVTTLEIDPHLAARATKNLRAYPWVRIHACDAAAFTPPDVDAILVNAGITHLPRAWWEHLRSVLVAPFFIGATPSSREALVLRIARAEHRFLITPITTASIYPCASLRDETLQQKMRDYLRAHSIQQLHSLRMDQHEPNAHCLVHDAHLCFSSLEASID